MVILETHGFTRRIVELLSDEITAGCRRTLLPDRRRGDSPCGTGATAQDPVGGKEPWQASRSSGDLLLVRTGRAVTGLLVYPKDEQDDLTERQRRILKKDRRGPVPMREDLFQELVESVREGGAILRGQKPASRRFEYADNDVRAIRERYALSQPKFAALMGISVATLRNWEQGRRQPEGSARVLLRVVARYPDAVLDVVGVRAPRAERGAAPDRGQRAIRPESQRRVTGRGG